MPRKKKTTPSTPVAPAAASLGSASVAPASVLAGVHETHEGIEDIDLTPPHPPREDTPEYARAHHFLVYEKKAPCEVRGVTIETVTAPDTLETHHAPIERSYATACDPRRVHDDFPQVYDMVTLMQFVDSPANLKVLCSTHHRSKQHGIHHLLSADFSIQKYLRAGYLIATDAQGLAAALAQDEAIERQNQPTAAAPTAPAPSKPRTPRKRRTPKAQPSPAASPTAIPQEQPA